MPKSRKFYKVAVISDLHSLFLDLKAFSLFLQIYSDNEFDELIINGDLVDMPTISQHSAKIGKYSPNVLRDYCFDEELDYTEEMILAPLRRARRKAKVTVRLGNHEERFLYPTKTNQRAIAEILEVSRRRNSLRLGDMLNLSRYKMRISYNEVDVWKKRFAVTHGVKLSGNRCKQYLAEFMMSGTSGHTHKGLKAEKRLYDGRVIRWMESYCLRTLDNVEYFKNGQLADWQHGFVDVWFGKSGEMFMKQHPFSKNYSCIYGGVHYKV